MKSKKIISHKKLQLTLFFIVIISLINPADSPNMHSGFHQIDKNLFRSGDIIFRRGTSFVSIMVLNLDKRSPYSHTGIAKIIDNEVFIIHSVPGESAGEKDRTKIESLRDFLRKDRATSIAVYRLMDENESIVEAASDFAYEHGINETDFDVSFDLSDDSRLYCTELIWKSYLHTGVDLIDSSFDKMNLPLSNGPYILPGTLLASKKLKQIYSINFKRG